VVDLIWHLYCCQVSNLYKSESSWWKYRILILRWGLQCYLFTISKLSKSCI